MPFPRKFKHLVSLLVLVVLWQGTTMTVALAGKLSTGQSKTIRFPKVRSIGELGVGTVMQFTLDLIKKSAPKMPMAQEKNTVLYRLHDYCSHFSNNGDFIMGVRL